MNAKNVWIAASLGLVALATGCGTTVPVGTGTDATATDTASTDAVADSDSAVADSDSAADLGTTLDTSGDVDAVGDTGPADADSLDAVESDATVSDGLTGADSTDATQPPDSTDISSSDVDATQPTACGMGGNNCGLGLSCWTPSCPNCGAKPMGWCLPTLIPGNCYDYANCDSGICHGASPAQGKAGWCLAAVDPGQCWPESSEKIASCYPGSTCEGASICPPNADCVAPDKPGTCTPSAGDVGKVILWPRSGGMVGPGQSVPVTWINNSKNPIYLGGCNTYNGESSSDGSTWKALPVQADCLWEGIEVKVLAGTYADTQAWMAPANPGLGQYRLSGDYATGCIDGKPLSQASCQSTATVKSAVLTVGLAP